MRLKVEVEKTLHSPGRSFHLSVHFETSEELVVIFGPSGAGKSVTLQAIAGLLTPDRGIVQFGGETVFDSDAKVNLPARLRRMGYVFQDYALFPHQTVLQNVSAALAPLVGHALNPAQRERVHALLEVFELTPVQASYPSQISGGQRQRTALARALAAEPRLLLLDEPFNSLDSGLRAKMREEVLQIWQRFKVPIVLITHDEADAEVFGREVLTIDNGRVAGSQLRAAAPGSAIYRKFAAAAE
jgi:molybdate transport system ATP-binding protein